MAPEVDVVILTRDEQPLRSDVAGGLARQRGVRLQMHRVIGGPRPQDVNRWQSIARARNRGAELGDAPWFMFLDDDVVLHPDCIRTLIDHLERQPAFGALAADYLGETSYDGPSRHVVMGATVFRRRALAGIRYRWQSRRCECQCCCDDLRAAGWEIAYCRAAKAWHMPVLGAPPKDALHPGGSLPVAAPTMAPRILAAFNRGHLAFFCKRFLNSLRSTGNDEWVTAVTYGLHSWQQRILGRMRHIEVVNFAGGTNPALDRMRDFQTVLMRWPPDTPVAYWDAGDVWFQGSLQGLWDLVRDNPQQLLVAREPFSHPDNPVVAAWTLTIHNPQARQAAFALLSSRPVINGGFAAGTAATMLRYLQYAYRLRHSRKMFGTRDWGDQTALNLYCHANPTEYKEVDRGWNFCVCGLPANSLRREANGRMSSVDGTPIHVIHGNAGTLTRVLRI